MVLLLLLPILLEAQTATVRVEENLRTEPNGVLLGQVMAGTELRSPRPEGQWVEVVLEGWIWTRSLQVRDGEEMSLVVAAEDGENLRDAPSGRVAARLGRGTLLEEVDRVPGWIRVRRTGWIWASSLTMSASTASAPRTTPPAAPAEAERARPAEGGAASPSHWLRAGEEGAVILGSPDGDTLGSSRSGAELRLMAREGNWARVQLEGWVWLPSMAPEDEVARGEDAVLSGVTATELAREPDRYRSRLVELELQFISLERAERIRTDFYEGEPFLLTRATHGDGGFVYVALTADRLEEVRGFTPLERIVVVGRVRTGSAGLTGSPIVDLLEIRRFRGRNSGSP